MNIELALNLARHAEEASSLAGNEVCQRIMRDCASMIRDLLDDTHEAERWRTLAKSGLLDRVAKTVSHFEEMRGDDPATLTRRKVWVKELRIRWDDPNNDASTLRQCIESELEETRLRANDNER